MDPVSALFNMIARGGVQTADNTRELPDQPTMNVFAEHERYVLMVPLPGCKQDDITLEIEEVDGGEEHLHLRALYRDPFAKNDQTKSRYVVKEYDPRAMERCLGLPTDVDVEKITTTFQDGMLTVNMPRRVQPKLPAKVSRQLTIGKQD